MNGQGDTTTSFVFQCLESTKYLPSKWGKKRQILQIPGTGSAFLLSDLSFPNIRQTESLACLNCDLENHEVQTLPRLENLWTVSGNWAVTVVFFACQWFEIMSLKSNMLWKLHFVPLFWLLFLMCQDKVPPPFFVTKKVICFLSHCYIIYFGC